MNKELIYIYVLKKNGLDLFITEGSPRIHVNQREVVTITVRA